MVRKLMCGILGLMLWGVPIADLQAKTPDAPASSEDKTKLGLGAGLIVAPTLISRNPVFVGGVGSLDIDHKLGKFSLHFSAILGGGAAPETMDSRSRIVGAPLLPSRDINLGAALADLQLRFVFNQYIRSGIGGYLGLAFGQVASGTAVAFWFGPSLTPIALQFLKNHEIGLWLGASFAVVNGSPQFSALLPTLRYIYYF